MHNSYSWLNSNTTTHIRIGSTVVYTLGLCALDPTRIFFVASLLRRQPWKLRCRKHNRNAQFRHTMSRVAPRPIHNDIQSPTARKANASPVFRTVHNLITSSKSNLIEGVISSNKHQDVLSDHYLLKLYLMVQESHTGWEVS
jgi:hypothetical protein